MVPNHGLPRVPLHTITDPGVFLQELERIRACEYVMDERKHEESVHCIAAPVRNHLGEVVVAISISGPAKRMPEPLAGSEMAVRVMETARLISRALNLSESFPFQPAWNIRLKTNGDEKP